MGGLRRLSGDDVIRIFLLAGIIVQSQKGSHVKLRRLVGSETQTLTIPRHRELDTGTLRAIVRQAGRFLPDVWLKDHFFDP